MLARFRHSPDTTRGLRFNGPVADIRRTRTMAAGPQAIWDVLSDFGAISSWARTVDHSCLLEHGAEPGLGMSRRIQVGRDTLVERVVEFSPPDTLGYDIEGLPRRLAATNRWTLVPIGGDRTEVTLTSTVRVGANPLATLVERAVCRLVARQSDAMLAGLAQRVESSHV
ncbi:MxaD family protein [Mycolicibacterium litorale]|nr:MxaD family protein [Mycolicibacterium litorale]